MSCSRLWTKPFLPDCQSLPATHKDAKTSFFFVLLLFVDFRYGRPGGELQNGSAPPAWITGNVNLQPMRVTGCLRLCLYMSMRQVWYQLGPEPALWFIIDDVILPFSRDRGLYSQRSRVGTKKLQSMQTGQLEGPSTHQSVRPPDEPLRTAPGRDRAAVTNGHSHRIFCWYLSLRPFSWPQRKRFAPELEALYIVCSCHERASDIHVQSRGRAKTTRRSSNLYGRRSHGASEMSE